MGLTRQRPYLSPKLTPEEREFISALIANRFEYKTKLREHLTGKAKTKINEIAESLQEKGLILIIPCYKTTQTADYFAFTDLGNEVAKIKKTERISTKEFKHYLYCKRVADFLKSKGLEPIREYHVTKQVQGNIDVYCEHNGTKAAMKLPSQLATCSIISRNAL